MISTLVQIFIDKIVVFATDLLIPIMVITFFFSVILRLLTYYTIKRNEWFTKEFEKRVSNYFNECSSEIILSFYATTKKILERTYYEIFEIRDIMKRRKPDFIMSLSDRIFLIKPGSARLVRDVLKHVKFLKRENNEAKFLEISKNVFQNNPCFTKILGIVPTGATNEILNILPGILIVGGIFGTFLGIMKALPELGGMDLTSPEETKLVMDQFLLRISFSMSTSLVGIMLSVALSVLNALFSPEKLFVNTINRFESCLDIIWNRSNNNDLTLIRQDFDEHKDALEALAEESVTKEVNRYERKKVSRKAAG